MNPITKIKKILVANRGEIAIRVMKTAKLMGIKTVAVCSDIDINAKFVSEADEVVRIGGVTSRESYLVIDKIIDACKQTGADAVHPGYGFLSEKPEFVERCEKEGIIFIGPSAKSMQMMGDKITSKETAGEAGVSVVPGFVGVIKTKDEAKKVAEEIGFPVIIKASAGGGGKGMKIVYNLDDLLSAMESAENEARNAFGDDRIFIEKYIEKPHHIEIQIIADKYGNVVCLGERECSIQRFNQKIIEESPSPFVSEATRQKMYEQSIKLAKKCGYFSAGTIEYIMDDKQNFYFLEMNTRLQVEHPVTEFVTGKDLVQLMIKIAEGEKLEFKQEDVKLNGSSIECRICAEDPLKGFMPSIGRINYYREPKRMHNVIFRIDSGVVDGSDISSYYDSMIAKVITHGDTRKEAIESMKKVLGQFEIAGIVTNINLLEDIIRNQTFISGHLSTWFIKEQYPNGFSGSELQDETKKSVIVAVIKFHLTKEKQLWETSGQYKLTRDKDEQVMDIIMCEKVCDMNHAIRYNTEGSSIVCMINGEKIVFDSDYKVGDMIITGKLNNRDIYVKIISFDVNNMVINSDGAIISVRYMPRYIGDYQKYMPPVKTDVKPKHFKSPISGLLVKVHVEAGDRVTAGQELLIIEAMKMENIIRADCDAIIKKVHKGSGSMLAVNDLIIDFQYDE